MKKGIRWILIGIGVVFLVLLVGGGLTGYIVLPGGPLTPDVGDIGEGDVAEGSGIVLDEVDDATVTQGEIDELAEDIEFILEEENVEELVIEEVVGVIEENLKELVGEEITESEIDELVGEVGSVLDDAGVDDLVIDDVEVVIEEEIGEVELELVCGNGYEMNFDRCVEIEDKNVTQEKIDAVISGVQETLENSSIEDSVVEDVNNLIEENLENFIGEEITESEVDKLVEEVGGVLDDAGVDDSVVSEIGEIIEDETGGYKEELGLIDFDVEELEGDNVIVGIEDIDAVVSDVQETLEDSGIEDSIVDEVNGLIEETMGESIGVEMSGNEVVALVDEVQEAIDNSDIGSEEIQEAKDAVEAIIEEKVVPIRTIKIKRNDAKVISLDLKGGEADRVKEIKIIRPRITEKREFVIVRNVVLKRGESKTIYIQRKSRESNAVCVNDKEGLEVVDDILDGCQIVPCPGRVGDYRCRVNRATDTFVVSGLKHSGVIEGVLSCGDGLCFGGESCFSCSKDCGSCQGGNVSGGIDWEISDETIKWIIIIGGALFVVVVIFVVIRVYGNKSKIQGGVRIISKENSF